MAAAIVPLIESGRYGIYHLVNEGWCSRHQFAQQVLACSGREQVAVTPISHKEWQRAPTQPPLHAVLVNQAAAALGIRLRPWEEAVEEYCRQEGGLCRRVAGDLSTRHGSRQRSCESLIEQLRVCMTHLRRDESAHRD